MRIRAGILSMAALLVVVVAQPGHAQANQKSIWDGVYTNAQAQRGQQLSQQNCNACHSSQEWSHQGFLGAWAGRPLVELHTMIRSSMPLDGPGRLTAQQYSDIIAYMLRLSQAPAGQTELPAGDDALRQIRVTRRGS